MIRSMTGYGAATKASEYGEFFAEIRSVNNRYLDLNLRLPRELGFLEPPVRDYLRNHVRRGKVDLFLRWTPAPSAPPPCEINLALLRHFTEELRPLLEAHPQVSLDLGALMALPGVVNPTVLAAESQALGKAALEAVRAAFAVFDQARRTEGAALANAVRAHLAEVERCVTQIEQLKTEIDAAIRERLAERIRELAATAGVAPEPGRLEMELALAADKADVTEELVRLRAHLAAFKKALENSGPEPVGKTFDFVLQELHREITTLGTKARHAAISPAIVAAKNELEKIREQVQNIE